MKRSHLFILFLAAIFARVVVSHLTNYAVDDAFITFRYAENIAAGNGFVYNLGEKVLGTTTPLFTLLIALFNFFGIGSVTAAMIINLAAAGLTSVILYRWAYRLGLDKLAFLPALIYTVFPRSLICDICGMETGFFTMLVTAGLYCLHTRRHLPALVIASLAAVTRPEGWALLGLAVVIALFRDRRALLAGLIPIVIIAGGWLLFAQLYFGSFIPNSLTAKMALYANYERFSSFENAAVTLGLNSLLGWAIWVIYALGLIVLLRKDRLLCLLALWCAAYLGVLAASGTHVFFWYPAPVYPVVLLIMVYAANHFWKATLLAYATSRWLPAVLGILVILSSAAYLSKRIEPLRQEMATYRNVHVAAAAYLTQNANSGDRLLAEDIGYLGYHYRGTIIDRDGLVTPQAATYNRTGDYLRFADSVNAQWLFLDPDYPTAIPIVSASDFAQRYQPILLHNSSDNPCHRLYRLITH